MGTELEARLEELRQSILGCMKCPLCESRTRAVPGEGNLQAEVMFIGQGPGANEDCYGRSFVGRAGDLLNELFRDVVNERSDVWISNVTRCLPPKGRLPFAAEIKTCAPYLVEQIELIGPKVVCPLGNMALHLFVEKSKVIHEVHGKPVPQDKFFLFPMYHSAAALRRPDLLPQVRADFTALKTFLDFEETLEPQPGQQSLF